MDTITRLERNLFKQALKKKASRTLEDEISENVFAALNGLCSKCGNISDEVLCQRCK